VNITIIVIFVIITITIDRFARLNELGRSVTRWCVYTMPISLFCSPQYTGPQCGIVATGSAAALTSAAATKCQKTGNRVIDIPIEKCASGPRAKLEQLQP
jgi:hypothetical protein